jgi:Na+-driven multidrug efflux pump
MSKYQILEFSTQILKSAFTVAIGNILCNALLAINLFFVGRLGDPKYLAAVGLSGVLISFTGGILI